MKNMSLMLGLALNLMTFGVFGVFGAPITFAGKNCYFGTLHAHTVLSPDFKPRPSNNIQYLEDINSNTPARFAIPNGPYLAYKRAADLGKLDFLAITDHVHGEESDAPSGFCRDEMPNGGHQLIWDSAAKIAADPAYQNKFLAIPGAEWSSISSGNHANIFFGRNPIPNSIRNGDYRSLLTNYLNNPALEGNNQFLLMQLNHPNQNSASYGRNYGRNQFPSGTVGYQQFLQFFGNRYMGIEHINNSTGGNENTSETNQHRDGNDLEQHYRKYLNMGFRLAPIGDHDNHRANWGRHTAARTGVWADNITAAGFVEAYKARRVFATEDNEMAVAFLSQNVWMGSAAHVPASGQNRNFTVMVTQMADTDTGQLQNEGPYIVELFGDEDGIGGAEAQRLQFTFNGTLRSSIQIQPGQPVQISRLVRPGSYYYLHVREMNGLDSGGDEQDAWTSPIFFRN